MQRVRPTTHLSSEKQTRRELDCLRIRERVSWLTCSCQRILAALRTVHARVGSEGAITHRSPSAWLPATLTARACARSPQHRHGGRSSGPEYFQKKKSPGVFPLHALTCRLIPNLRLSLSPSCSRSRRGKTCRLSLWGVCAASPGAWVPRADCTIGERRGKCRGSIRMAGPSSSSSWYAPCPAAVLLLAPPCCGAVPFRTTLPR